ncbi:stalk domain-containing protein [Geosporobacter ferrireducens]|uniref:Copper amine oxidase-like N-terminal domain-containing protein n=1 Tax=Geosporobacter ferrireducens TaxID=1424294 RepID=A0A1D8GG86_9FIRM|nr:stalk domain-containing protein [Geosporobacter ferrireducens]AOT69944.1 hypothetical protein Gferi_10320 [Geosporobacter ferrireducens]MTI54360.1 hypothetical protein [Geosporobacter ferrireducens]
MLRRSLIFIMLMVTLLIFPVISSAQIQEPIHISINNNYVPFDEATGYPFIDENNRIQVPLRVTLETFGAIVEWKNEAKTVLIQKNDIKIEVPINEPYILVNGKKVDNDAPSLIKNNRIYLPIRVIMEHLGSQVRWDSQLRTVSITYTIDENNEKIQNEQPQVKIEAPSKSEKNQATIKIITDKENSIYLNGNIINLDANNEYIVELKNIKNEFEVVVVNNQALKTTTTFTIERIIDEIYLNVEAENKSTEDGKVLITGNTNPENTVTINGKKVSTNKKGEFEYWLNDLQPNNNIVTVIAENKESNKKIEKKIDVYYDKNLKVEEDYYGSSSPEKETEYKKPVIYLDEEIPEVTDQESFTVSGTCENTEYIIVQSPLNFNTRTKPVNNRFSITVKLSTDNEIARKEKGIGNVVTIIAENGDKIFVKEYVVYYNKE